MVAKLNETTKFNRWDCARWLPSLVSYPVFGSRGERLRERVWYFTAVFSREIQKADEVAGGDAQSSWKVYDARRCKHGLTWWDKCGTCIRLARLRSLHRDFALKRKYGRCLTVPGSSVS
jgi:hypothetical protein